MMKLLTLKYAAGFAMMAALPGAAIANTGYPDKPIAIIVPYGPGGVTDLVARALGESMGRYLKQTVVIENKPGAAGSMGAIEMLTTKPDGYRLTLTPHGIFRQPYLQKTPYDPVKDLSYIATFATYDFLFVVDEKSPIKTIKQLIDYARDNPGALTVGTPGRYTGNQVAMVETAHHAGVKMTHVPFKGDADAITALLGGHVKAAVTANSILPYLKSGKVRGLAIASKVRPEAFASVPTLTESGYPVVTPSPLGLGGPKGLPADIVQKLDGAVQHALKDPAFLKTLGNYGMQTYYMNPEQYSAFAVKTFAEEKSIVGRMGDEK